MQKSTIKKYTEFKFVINNGTKTFEKYGIVFKLSREKFVKKFPRYTKNTAQIYGIMTTRKLGMAVTRNYIKRKIRIAIRTIDMGHFVWVIIGNKPDR